MAIKNKYKIERKYISNKKARGGQKNNVKFLVAHETANNNADADAHYKYFNNITFSASAHTFIDDKKILEIIPINEKAWHVMYNQDKRVLGLGYANDNAIGTELCRPGNFKEAYDRYVWYHAYLCKKFGLQPKKHIVSHKVLDPQRRSDPQSWLNPNGVTWDQFINDVQNYFVNWEGKTNSEPAQSKPANDKLYRVRSSWGNASSQKGAFASLSNAKALADKHKGYKVYDHNGKVVYPKTPAKKDFEWVGTNLKGRRVESIYKGSDGLNYYDGPRWNNPSGTFKYGHGWIVDNLYRVNGSLMYRVQNSKGDLYWITASSKYVKVK